MDEHACARFLEEFLVLLERVHSNGVIHRDIKPGNIIIRTKDQKPVLIDFGIVKEIVTLRVDDEGDLSSIIMGTRGYAPSEQLRGAPVFATDLYSLGVTAIFLLTGKEPTTMIDKTTGELRWQGFVSNLSDDFAGVICKSIEFSVQNRYQSAENMREAVRGLQAFSSLPVEQNSTPVSVATDPEATTIIPDSQEETMPAPLWRPDPSPAGLISPPLEPNVIRDTAYSDEFLPFVPAYEESISPDNEITVGSAAGIAAVPAMEQAQPGSKRILVPLAIVLVITTFAYSFFRARSVAHKRIATANEASNLHAVAPGSIVSEFPGYSDPITQIRFSPDGVLLGCNDGKSLKVWNIKSGDQKLAVEGASAFYFSPDTRFLVATYETGQNKKQAVIARVWDIGAGHEVLTLNDDAHPYFTPDGMQLVSSNNGSLRYWDTRTWEFKQQIKVKEAYGGLASFSSDSRLMARVSYGDFSYSKRLYTGIPDYSPPKKDNFGLWVFPRSNDSLSNLSIPSFVSVSNVQLWDTEQWKLERNLSVYNSADTFDGMTVLSFSPDGKNLAVGVSGKGISLIDVASGKKIWSNRDRSVEGLLHSARGNLLLAVFKKSIKVLDAQTGVKKMEFDLPSKLRCSPDDQVVAIERGNTVQLWDLQTGAQRFVINKTSYPVFTVNTRLVVSNADEKSIKLLDVQTGAEVFSLTNAGPLFAISPDNHLIASAGEDYIIRVWDISEIK